MNMTRWLTSGWVAALAGCLLYLATTALLIRPVQFEGARLALAAAKLTPDDDPSWKFKNPEFEQSVAELKLEKNDLDTRAQQLQELQARLAAQQQEFSTATQSVYQLQAEFDRNVIRIKAQEVQNLSKQAKIISGMSPEGAANLINEMADEDVVRLLSTMKTDEASLILDSMSKLGKVQARRAADLTEQLRLVLPPDTAGAAKSSP
jgi:flagellar motility protein MotE (MotC chaperone)